MNDRLGTRKIFSFLFLEILSLFLGLIFPTFDNDQKYFPFLLPLLYGNNIASMMINTQKTQPRCQEDSQGNVGTPALGAMVGSCREGQGSLLLASG